MATNQSSTEVLNKVEAQITCPICMEHCTDPRVLPCFHSYCLKCLQDVPIDNHSLPCPTCQSLCPVPDKGLASLPPSFVVNNLMEVYDLMKKASAHQHFSCGNCDSTKADRYCRQCATFLCPECLLTHNNWKPHSNHQILTLDEVASEAHQLQHAKQDLSKSCDDHNKSLDLFCESCQQLICHDCTVKKHEKPHHEYDFVTDTYYHRKGEIDQSCCRPLNKKHNRLVAAKKVLTSKRDEIPKSAQSAQNEIWQKIDEQKKHLDKLGSKLAKEVNFVAQLKIEVLEEQIKEVDTAIDQVRECRDRVDQCVKVATRHQVLLTARKIINHTKSVIASIEDSYTFRPLEQPDIQLVECETIPKACDIIGKIKTSTFASFAKVTLSCCDRYLATNRKSTVTIALSLPDGSPAPVPLSHILCRITDTNNFSSYSYNRKQCSIKESSIEAGQYFVDFTPKTKDRYELHVTVNGNSISGSPVIVQIT